MIQLKTIIHKLLEKFLVPNNEVCLVSLRKGRALTDLLRRTRDFEVMINVLQTNRFRRAIRPNFVHHPQAQRILVFAPHQDDAIIGAGGVLKHAAQAGTEIIPVYITDGATRIPGHTLEEVVEIRKREAHHVWQQLNGTAPLNMDLPCGNIPLNEATAHKMAEYLTTYKPDCLFLPFLLEDPNDHRKANHLLWLSSQVSSLPMNIVVWAYQVTTMICPNVAVDITDVIDEKKMLMELWQSQNSVFDYTHQVLGMNAANTLYCKGTKHEGPRPRYVELFFVLPLNEYLDLLNFYFADTNLAQIYDK